MISFLNKILNNLILNTFKLGNLLIVSSENRERSTKRLTMLRHLNEQFAVNENQEIVLDILTLVKNGLRQEAKLESFIKQFFIITFAIFFGLFPVAKIGSLLELDIYIGGSIACATTFGVGFFMFKLLRNLPVFSFSTYDKILFSGKYDISVHEKIATDLMKVLEQKYPQQS